MRPLVTLAALLGTALPAAADPAAKIAVAGYVQPEVDLTYRARAVPEDRLDYGLGGTRTGVIVTGAPVPQLGFTLHVVASPALVQRLGAGDTGAMAPSASPSAGVVLERATVEWRPGHGLELDLGQQRIPLTIDQQSANTALLFPSRSGPTEVFLSGSDPGGLAAWQGARGRVAVGVFDGRRLTGTSDDERGLVYAVRGDLTPLGALPATVDSEHGPLRLGLGGGVAYYPASHYDGAGFATTQVRDLRAALSLRLALRGFTAQAELLRRQATDSLSARPALATGAYAQLAYYAPLSPRYGVAPIARLGWTREDESFDPRTTVWTELGASGFLRADQGPDAARLTVTYRGENRLSEGETAHGVVAQLQLAF